MNAALTAWLMTPEAPDEALTLWEFVHPPAWHQDAACRNLGIEAFMGSRGRGYGARDLCEGCPVRQECLEVALADPYLLGLWGGTSEGERRAMRRDGAVA